MKRLLFLLFLFPFLSSYSQSPLLIKGRLPIDSFYLDKDDYLISSFVYDFPDINKAELLKRTKNWGAINFVNLKEVLVGETEDQLVFNYITDKFSKMSWYIRLIVQFKDERVRIQFFDDGNATNFDRGWSARKYHFTKWFNDLDKPVLSQKGKTDDLLVLKEHLHKTYRYLVFSVEQNKVKKDDW